MSDNGISRIAAERRRQIEAEGYSADHDARHVHGSPLAAAAIAYAYAARVVQNGSGVGVAEWFGGKPPAVVHWPWRDVDWKPSDDPIRNLEKAGALIAAEIDRLLRGES